MMEVPQLHGFGPAANRLLEAYQMLLKVSFHTFLYTYDSPTYDSPLHDIFYEVCFPTLQGWLNVAGNSLVTSIDGELLLLLKNDILQLE